MLVEITSIDLKRLIRGYSPSYEQMDYLKGFGQCWESSGWEWDDYSLDKLSEQQLWDLYQKLNTYKPKSYLQILEENKQKEIDEIQSILDDGIKRGNQGQIKAAQEELDRLRKLACEEKVRGLEK